MLLGHLLHNNAGRTGYGDIENPPVGVGMREMASNAGAVGWVLNGMNG